MEAIYNKLEVGTQILKEEYLQRTRDWAKKSYDSYIEKSKWNQEKWCQIFGIQPRVVNEGTPNQFIAFPKGFYNTKESKTYSNAQNEISKIMRLGKDKYIQKMIEQAEHHYKQSLEKLAYRIKGSEMNFLEMQVITSKIGVNIDTIISDGTNRIEASTIIASGPIQRPHYRYLIKTPSK